MRSLAVAAVVLGLGVVACGKPLEGTCEESLTCADDAGSVADATSPTQGDGSSVVPPGHDAGTDTSTGSPDAGDDGTAPLGEDAGADVAVDVGSYDAEPACDGGSKVCGGRCVPVNDPAYGCAATSCAPCALAHATATCSAAGTCAVAQCDAHYGHCTQNAADGCETSLEGNPNCGQCNVTCPSGQTCNVSGATASCQSTCAGVVCGSTCTDTSTDPQHCGTCTTACTAPTNGNPTCSGGKCGSTCPATLPNLCGSACVNESTDANNCGACGAVCTAPKGGSTSCQSAKCAPTCPSALPSLCGNACVNETSDDNNCGACGKTCTPPANASASHCSASACVPVCNPGFHLCGSGCYSDADLPTDDPVHDSCVVSEPFGIFVSSSRGSDSGPGTRAAPFRTIAEGLAAAKAANKRLYACAETYTEAVTLTDGVPMFGYFQCAGGNWGLSSAYATVTPTANQATTAMGIVAMTASGLTKATRVEKFKFLAPDAPAKSGSSSYGAFVVNTTGLTLVDTWLTAGNGGSGADGGTGPIPSENDQVGTGPTTCPAAGGGTSGQQPVHGTYSTSGYAPGIGTAGSPGQAGTGGTAGGAGQCQDTGCVVDKVDQVCGPKGQVCAKDGTNGTGGPGGAAGLGGQGGGASIGLFVWQANVTLNGGAITGKAGGVGGAGASGLSAGTIVNGVCPSGWWGCHGSGGGTQTVSFVPCAKSSSYPNCTAALATITDVSIGSPGGDGCPGGPGGSGVGGDGGDSYAYYKGSGATITVTGATPAWAWSTQPAAGGTGGAGSVSGTTTAGQQNN